MLVSLPESYADAAFQYGKHLGIAFQLVDDLLDFEGTATSLGKPSLNDLKQVIDVCCACMLCLCTLAARFPYDACCKLVIVFACLVW